MRLHPTPPISTIAPGRRQITNGDYAYPNTLYTRAIFKRLFFFIPLLPLKKGGRPSPTSPTDLQTRQIQKKYM
jgi:hypothetical protein